MPRRTDISSILIIGAGPIVIGQACEFDYSGTQACKALKAEGYRIVLVNSNPATIMTDPDSGGRHLYRADHAGNRRQDHREGTLRPARRFRAVAHHGRADRAQHRAVAAPHGRSRQVRHHHDRRHRRSHRQGGRSQAVPRGDDQDRACDAALASGQDADPGAAGARRYRPAGDHPAVVHARRHRRRHRLQQGGVHRDRRARHRRLADLRGADRGIGARLERVRDGGGARQKRQLHHRLLDRERRPDGRAHRRLDHGGAGADA